MNKLIKKFADEASFLVEGKKIFAPDSFDSINDQLLHFAELIIQECIKVADDSQYSCRTFPVSTTLRQHFGVK